MLVTQYGSINMCFKLYAKESYSLADSKEGYGGPWVQGSGDPDSSIYFFVPSTSSS